MDDLQLLRGDICMVDLYGVGSMQQGKRPSIIFSGDECNGNSPTVTVIPLTSQSKPNIPTHAKINRSTGITKTSTALAECITTVDKSLILKKVGRCSELDMRKIEQCVLHHCGIKSSIS